MPESPQTPRGVATYQRILETATEEFARHGIAGARIERIVKAARTNKAQLYAYFGDKELLFDAIFLNLLERITDVVPIDADDLADWAVRLYDEYLHQPDLVRLATWTRLERRPTGHLVETRPDETHPSYEDHKLAAIAEAQAAGRVRSGNAFDIMAMVIAMSMAWSPVSSVYAASDHEPGDVHDQRRALLRDCVRRAIAAD